MPPPHAELRSRKVEQGEHTRAHLVAVARRLLSEHGYAATSTNDVVRAAAVTRGALYHHFKDKQELFEAVFEAVESDLTARVVTEAARGRTPISQLRRGLGAFLGACLDQEVQRIVLRDGLAVLGWERWYEIDVRYALGSLVAAITAAMEVGEIRRQAPEPLAHVVLGAMNHAGMYIAGSPDPERARREMERALLGLVDALRA